MKRPFRTCHAMSTVLIFFLGCAISAGFCGCGSSSGNDPEPLDFSQGQFRDTPFADRVVPNPAQIGASVAVDPATGDAYMFWSASRGIAGARLLSDHTSLDPAMSSCDTGSPPTCTLFTDPEAVGVNVPGIIYDEAHALWYLFYAATTDPSNDNHHKIKYATAASPLTLATGLGYTIGGTAIDDNYDPAAGYHTPSQYLDGSYGERMVRFASSPEVLQMPDGTYILYFSVHVLETAETGGTEIGRLHIGTATADQLSGPWTLQSYSLPDCGDPSALSKDGLFYLFSSALDASSGGDPHKDAFAVSSDGLTFEDQQIIRHFNGDGTEITDRSFGDTDVVDYGDDVRAYVNDAELEDGGQLVMQGTTTFTFPFVP